MKVKKKKYLYRYCTEDGLISYVSSYNNFKLGDIVKIHNYGRTYTTYESAFRYFNIIKYCVYDKTYECFKLELKNNYDDEALKDNWVIIGMAVHASQHNIICCIKNSNNKYLIICESALHLVPSYKNICNKGFFSNDNTKPLKIIK